MYSHFSYTYTTDTTNKQKFRFSFMESERRAYVCNLHIIMTPSTHAKANAAKI